MKVAAILYDFDHTLVDSPLDFARMRRGVMALIAAHGLHVPSAERKLILEVVQEAALSTDADTAARLRTAAGAHILGVELAAAERAEAIVGVAESLSELRRQGRKVAVITRNCRQVVEHIFRRFPMEHDVLLSRDDVARVKPDPEHALAALQAMGCAADEAILVGDFRGDLECAIAAGIVPIGVTTGRADEAELRAAGARHVLSSAAELPGWLAEMGW